MNKRGFTLLEVLIALSVLSISMLGIYALTRQTIFINTYALNRLTLVQKTYERAVKQALFPNRTYPRTETEGTLEITFTTTRASTPIPGVEEVRVRAESSEAQTELIYYEKK